MVIYPTEDRGKRYELAPLIHWLSAPTHSDLAERDTLRLPIRTLCIIPHHLSHGF